MAPFRQQVFVMVYVALLLCGAAALYVRPKVEDLPAWVQAVGSIAAILAAIWIAQWEAGRARRDRIETLREFRKAVAGLARRLADLVAAHADSLIENPSWHAHEGVGYNHFLLLDAALDRFDPSELVSAEGVLALESLRQEAKAASHYESIVAQDYLQEQYYDYDIEQAVRSWRQRSEEYAVTLEALAQNGAS